MQRSTKSDTQQAHETYADGEIAHLGRPSPLQRRDICREAFDHAFLLSNFQPIALNVSDLAHPSLGQPSSLYCRDFRRNLSVPFNGEDGVSSDARHVHK